MVHVLIGIAAIAWGLWMLGPDWMFAGEILKLVACLGLIGFGIVAILAGLRKFSTNK